MEFVIGAVSGTTTLTYVEADLPPSITIIENIENPGAAATDGVEIYSGTVFETTTIKTAVGEPVSVTLDLKSAFQDTDTTLSSKVELSTDDVFNFTGASIELPSGSVLPNIIDSMEITITNNWMMLAGLGSKLTKNAVANARDYSLKVSLKYLDNDLISQAKSGATPDDTSLPSEYATIKANFELGSRSFIITFTGVPISDFSRADELNNVIAEDLTLTPKSMSAVEVL